MSGRESPSVRELPRKADSHPSLRCHAWAEPGHDADVARGMDAMRLDGMRDS